MACGRSCALAAALDLSSAQARAVPRQDCSAASATRVVSRSAARRGATFSTTSGIRTA